jgi:uncharacterized DUF497 family protein
MPTVVEGDFEWDADKAASAIYLDDGSGIGRMVVIGASLRDRLLYVVHVERGERDRIISARPATSPERDVYQTGGDP